MADYPLLPTISAGNSTNIPLIISGLFTGASFECLNYSTISINVFSNVASATDGLQIQQSSDGVNWRITDSYTIPANTGKTFSSPRTARYCRVVYTNGGTLQTTFELQTILSIEAPNPSSVRPQDNRTNDNDMLEVVVFPMVYDNVTNTWSRDRGGDAKSIVGRYVGSTFRTAGLASANHNLLTLENPVGSGKSVGVKAVTYSMDTTAASVTASSIVKLGRTTAIPTLGVATTAAKYKTADATAVAIMRTTTSTDGGAPTAITATIGSVIRGVFQNRLATVAGYMAQDTKVLMQNTDDDLFVLAPGEGIVVQVVASAAATMNYTVDIQWVEFT